MYMKKIRNLDMDSDSGIGGYNIHYHLDIAIKEMSIGQIISRIGIEKVENELRKLKIKKLTNNK